MASILGILRCLPSMGLATNMSYLVAAGPLVVQDEGSDIDLLEQGPDELSAFSLL